MDRLVLLGATGFAGGEVLRAWETRHRDDCALSCLTRRVAPFPQDVDLHYGSLDVLPSSLFPREPYVLGHFAVAHDQPGLHRTNVDGMRHVIRHLDPGYCRGVIYGSSMSVYGRGPHVDVTEEQPLQPATSLAKTRALAEQQLFDWGRRHGVCVVSLRPRFVLSARERDVRPGLAKLASSRWLPGSGEQRLSLITGDDFAESVFALARQLPQRRTQEGVNLAYTYAPTLIEILQCVAGRVPRYRVSIPHPVWKLVPRWAPFVERLHLVSVDQALDCRRAVRDYRLPLERTRDAVMAELGRVAA